MADSVRKRWAPIFPKEITNEFSGFKFTLYVFYVFTALTIVRSLIHMFFPDGGAGSIASIDINVEGGTNIIGIFAQWGLSQLLFGIFYVIVAIHYKSLVPLMYLFIFVEYGMRIVMGLIKPLIAVDTPPGAIVNIVFVPLSIIMLVFSLYIPKSRL
jgi:hypothetical protein